MNEQLVEWVHFDLRHWPAKQRLDSEVKTDTFSPNTLSHLRNLLATDHRAQELIAKAETPEWSAELADELFAHLKTWLAKHHPVNTDESTYRSLQSGSSRRHPNHDR